MIRHRVITAGAVATVLIVVLLAVYVVLPQSEDSTAVHIPDESVLPVEMGITYLPITAQVVRYYGLAADHGVLVTEVILGSLADQSGVQVGDVVLSYNGAELREEVSLFGMMKECPVGSRITMEIQRGSITRTVELVHMER